MNLWCNSGGNVALEERSAVSLRSLIWPELAGACETLADRALVFAREGFFFVTPVVADAVADVVLEPPLDRARVNLHGRHHGLWRCCLTLVRRGWKVSALTTMVDTRLAL